MSESVAAIEGWRGTPVGDYLKSTSGWNDKGNGSNSSSFNALPSGYKVLSIFNTIGYYGFWWSSSESGSSSWNRSLYGPDLNVDRDRYGYHDYGFSSRCLRDYSTTNSVPTEPSSNRKLEKVIDALGREVNHTTNQILFHLYDDGSVEKKFVVE